MEIQETLIVPVTMGLVEVAKLLDPDKKLERVYPVISLAISTGLSFAFTYSAGEGWFVSLMAGLVYGLSASGLYSGTKSMLEKKK